MKRIPSLFFVVALTGALCAQPGQGQRPGGGQGQRPGGGFGQGQRPGGDRGQGETRRMMPSSLRLGLLETLGRIATNEAEGVLIKTLSVTASGVEVSLIDRMLTQIAQGEHKYVNEVLAAARDLILNPPDAPDVPSSTDQRATGELWSILRRYKDTTFAEKAGEILISEDGNLNREALRYFREVLEKDAVPILVASYKNADADDRAKGELWGVINDHIDDHIAAGEILVERFKESLVKMEEEETARAQREADRAAGGGEGGEGRDRGRGGFGGFGRGGGNSRGTAVRELQRLGEGKDLSAEAITNRRSILTGVKSATSDPDFQTMIASVETRLDELASPTEETSNRFRVEDPREAARNEERRQRFEQFRNNRGGEGGRTPPGKQ
jgi:hypothetical protein